MIRLPAIRIANAHAIRETEITVSIALDVTTDAPQKIKVESGIGFLDHVCCYLNEREDR